MKSKTTYLTLLLALSFFIPTASADESYRLTLSGASKIGKAELRSGDYKLVVDAGKIVLTEVKTGESVEIQAKVENVDKKFATTEVHSKQVDGVSLISEIRVGGSKTKIAFE